MIFKEAFPLTSILFLFAGLTGLPVCFGQHSQSTDLRQQMGIPPNETLLNRTHAERYQLLHKYYDNNPILHQLDTVEIGRVLNDVELFAVKHSDQDLLREVRYMRLVSQILGLSDRKDRVRLLEQRYAGATSQGQPWEVFLHKWLLGSQLLDTDGKVDIGFYLLTEASEYLEEGYPHPLGRYLNYLLGTAHYRFNDFRGARKYCDRALRYAEHDSLFFTDSRVLNTLGLVHRKLNNIDSSDFYFHRALEISIEQNDSIMECIISGNLGENQYLQGNYDAALPLLLKDANMALSNKDTGLASNAFLLMSECYLYQGDTDKCWKFLTLGRQYAYRSKQYHRLRTLYPILAKWHAIEGDPVLAALYTDSSRLVLDSLERLQIQVRSVPSDRLFEMNRLQLDSMEKQSSIKQRNLLLLGAFLLLVSLFLLFRLYSTRSKLTILQLESTNRGLQEKLRDFVNERLTITNTISPDLMDQVILTDAHWRDFLNMFNQAHPLFLVALNGRYPSLTQSETRLCCLTYLSLSDREMADMLGVGTNSIRVTRNRVRKKLLIDADQNLCTLLKAM